ncbi:MAG: UPF0158 family protein [Planctomycetota bacterium]|nr:UPF0158 family protein [Planctomycetota bacterium]
MAAIRIDADAMFRAMTAEGYKMIVYYLDRETGAVVPKQAERRLEAARKPAPTMAEETERRSKKAGPFHEVAAPVEKKKDLFADGSPPPKKDPFAGDFWKPVGKPKLDLFGDGPPKPVGPPKGPLFKDASGEKAAAGGPAAGTLPSEPVAPTVNDAPERLEGGRLLLIRPIPDTTRREWMAEFAKDCGYPDVRDRLREVLASSKDPGRGFQAVLSRYGRLSEQWERFYRRRALNAAGDWLRDSGIEYELVENAPPDRPF